MHKKKLLHESLAAVAIVVIVMIGYTVMMKSQEELLTQNSQSIASLPPKTNQTVPPKTTTSAAPAVDYCSTISASTFRSTSQQEVGLGPTGVAMGYWTMTFKNGTVEWNHSDFVETGSYFCSKNVVQIKLLNKAAVNATYNGTTKTFTWEGLQYKKVD